MGNSIFGWSYPPGCSGPPEEPDISPQGEEVYCILENEECSQGVIDEIVKIVDTLVYDKLHCPVCENIRMQEEYNLWASTNGPCCASPSKDKCEQCQEIGLCKP